MSIVKTYSLRIATLLAALLISVSVTAQEYRYEAGIGGGISGYLGDVNQSNVLKHPGLPETHCSDTSSTSASP